MHPDDTENIIAEVMDLPMRFRRVIKEEAGQMVMTPHHWAIKTLGVEGSMPMSTLAKRMDVTKQYVTAIVAQLVEEGLVERHQDRNDRRVVMVSLTQKGSEVLAERRQKVKEAFARRLSKLSDEDQVKFLSTVRELRSVISKLEDSK